MDDIPIELDKHRGMMAQKQTDMRRLLAEVQADQEALKLRRTQFEEFLLSTPATSADEAIVKARYLIQLYAATSEGSDPRRTRLIESSLQELDRLFGPQPDVT